MSRLIAALAATALLLGPSEGALARNTVPPPSAEARAGIAQAVASPRREADRARDPWRHPAETLAFFRIAPDMKVGEYAPGGGWYSRLLGLYVGPRGHLAGLFFAPSVFPGTEAQKQGTREAAAGFAQKVADATGAPVANMSGFTLDDIPVAEKGTFDRIVIMRMIHNLHRFGMLHHELTALRSLLKDDGLLGVEQHRARSDAPYGYADGNKGYMREKDVIALIEAHGFQLVARSEINANRRDPANHPEGVWTLPPTLRGVADADKPRLQAIGESDRMTLLFRKRP